MAEQRKRINYWFTQQEAAGYLGVHLRRLAQWRLDDVGPDWFRHTDGRIYYKVLTLYAWRHRGGAEKHEAARRAADGRRRPAA